MERYSRAWKEIGFAEGCLRIPHEVSRRARYSVVSSFVENVDELEH